MIEAYGGRAAVAQGRVLDSAAPDELILVHNASNKSAVDPFCHYTLVMLALSRTPVHLIRDGRHLSAPAPTSGLARVKGLSSLAGTVAHHAAYVLLHTHAPPADYPARSKSPLWRALTLNARRWGGIVNFAWSPEQAVHPAYKGVGEEAVEDGGEEAYVASVFTSSRRDRLEIPEVTLWNLDAVDAKIHAHCQHAESGETSQHHETDPVGMEEELAEKIFLYVCTHGSRDCRCGDTGGEVARALRREIVKRGIAGQVSVGQVGHVGGHKYAGNVLVYPSGDWLGTVQEADVPRLLHELIGWHRLHRRAKTTTALPPLCPPFWRGRMGLDKHAQLALSP